MNKKYLMCDIYTTPHESLLAGGASRLPNGLMVISLDNISNYTGVIKRIPPIQKGAPIGVRDVLSQPVEYSGKNIIRIPPTKLVVKKEITQVFEATEEYAISNRTFREFVRDLKNNRIF